MQRIPHDSAHANPCSKKILYPILRRSTSKQIRPHSQSTHLKSIQKNKSATRLQRSGSLKNVVKSHQKTSDPIQIGEILKKRSHKDLSFLHKCYEHVSIQNNTLIQQILIKDQKLDNLKLQIRKIQKQNQEVVQEDGFRYWHRNRQRSSELSISSQTQKMEVIISAESEEDDCSVAQNVDPFLPALKPKKPEQIQPKKAIKKKSQGEVEESFQLVSEEQISLKRVGSSKNLIPQARSGKQPSFSKLDQLRKRKGIAIRNSGAEKTPLQD